MEQEIKTQHLQGLSDLTLVAPIRQGLIGALETRSYASRLRAVLKTLHTLRVTSREYSLVRTISDSTDRIRTISDLRLAIHEPEQKLLLSVSFDRPWLPYLRIVKNEVGTLLDLIFCNCEGYVTSFDHSFAEYGAWIAQARTNTQFFYKTFASTVDDVMLVRQTEKLLRNNPPTPALDLDLAKLVAADPARIAQANGRAYPFELMTQGMQALSVLYRLVDQYPSDLADGPILQRAARELLREFGAVSKGLPPAARLRFGPQLAWFEAGLAPPPARPAAAPVRDDRQVQGGILKAFRRVTHGALLLFGLRNEAAAAHFLDTLRPQLTGEGAAAHDGVFISAAFTLQGLRRIGLAQAEIDRFPLEFVEGMEERAGLLGDVRGNHPRNWTLPERNWPVPRVHGAHEPAEGVQLAEVHLVLQLYTASASPEHEVAGNAVHPLHARVKALADACPGATLLSVQSMRRHLEPRFGNRPREHFGFIDGISQPEVGSPGAGPAWSNQVALGEILLGHANDNVEACATDPLCLNGSFLVVRKLRQDVQALDDALARAAAATGLKEKELKERMMGRRLDGDAMVGAATPPDNHFDYAGDPEGSRCPLTSHVRRTNPRSGAQPPLPRLMRRGMPYGPRVQDKRDGSRGIVFMAYNASIAEQFERIQGWIAGGNGTGALSEPGDPLLGVPQVGEVRTFRFHDGTNVHRVELDGDPKGPARPFVQLEWGAYLFTPSLPALKMLRDIAAHAATPSGPEPALVADGERTIERLRKLEAEVGPAASDLWKTAIEDPSARSTRSSEALWAAIRERHQGVLRTAYGVLVAEAALVDQVLLNDKGDYSVCGYAERLRASIGEIYLGLDDGPDDGPDYARQAGPANAAISSLSLSEAFDLARLVAAKVLKAFVDGSKAAAQQAGATRWELTLDVKELSDRTLAALCEIWFGLPGPGKHLQPGGWRWDWAEPQPPLYPGHFTAPSRYLFQPNPGAAAQRYGQTHGRALREAMNKFVAAVRASGVPPAGRIAQPIFAAFPDPQDNDLLARTLVGALMGFLPTVDGNLRATLFEWLDKGALWELRAAYLADPHPDTQACAKAHEILRGPLERTMQLRPVPELVWRTATRQHRLGGVELRAGDRVVVALVSATQQALAVGKTNACPVFGGDYQAKPAPRHACPGYEIGMGVLLGIIAALCEAGPMSATPAPLVVSLRGPL